MRISFDFDQTLTEPQMQELCKKFIALGADVFITTSRTNNSPNPNYTNDDLFDLANQLGIKKENIQFTNYDDKYKFVKEFDIHIDDDDLEIHLINSSLGNCLGVLYSLTQDRIANF